MFTYVVPKLLCETGCSSNQWRRYTRACHVKWPGWKIHRPGSSPGSTLPSPAYCFASVTVWTENKSVTISDYFICFILMVKWRRRPVFWGRQLKKGSSTWEKSASGWHGWRIFWPRNDLAPLLHWRRHCLGCTACFNVSDGELYTL